jgi:hypothetical protein
MELAAGQNWLRVTFIGISDVKISGADAIG